MHNKSYSKFVKKFSSFERKFMFNPKFKETNVRLTERPKTENLFQIDLTKKSLHKIK